MFTKKDIAEENGPVEYFPDGDYYWNYNFKRDHKYYIFKKNRLK